MHPKALVAVLLASLGWGFAAIGVRYAFDEGVTTFTVIDVRLAVGMLAVAAYGYLTGSRPNRQVWLRGSVLGIFRTGLGPVFFIGSLQFISAGMEALFITTIPLTTGIMARLWLKEHLTHAQIVGLLMGGVGVTVLIVSGESGLGAGEGSVLIGGALALAGSLSAAVAGVLNRKYAQLHDTTDLAVPMFVSGTVFAVAISAVFGGVRLGDLDAGLWLLLVALGLGSTLLPFTATLYAARFASAAQTAIPGYLAPIITLAAGILLLNEVVTPAIVLGGLLAFAGALLMTRGTTPRSHVTIEEAEALPT